jgi:hypothetical protein
MNGYPYGRGTLLRSVGMRQTTKIRREDIDRAAQHFDEAPEVQPEEVTRKETIRILGPTIKAMRRKGYNWNQISERLKQDGIPIEPDLLASYCRAAFGRRSRSAKRGRRASSGPAPGIAVPKQGKAPSATAVATEQADGHEHSAATAIARQEEGGNRAAGRAPARGRADTSGKEGPG